jgi:hypothetical protein
MVFPKVRFVPLIVLLACCSSAVRAASITGGVQLCVGTAASFCADPILNSLFLPLPYSTSDSFGPIGGVQGTYNEILGADTFGFLHVYDSSTVNIPGAPANASFEDAVNSVDTITISDPLLDGQPGFLVAGYTLRATISSSGIDQAALVAVESLGGSLSTNTTASVYTSSVSGKFTFPEALAFTYGTPFTYQLSLFALTGTLDVATSASAPGFTETPTPASGLGSATVDSSDTFILSLLEPEDQSGNAVSGATFSSESGTVYGPDGVVPEPSTLLLIAPAILVLSLVRRSTKPYPSR